jgi:hypothetical protein
MVSRVRTVAFQGFEAVPVDVQVMIAPGADAGRIACLGTEVLARPEASIQVLQATFPISPTSRARKTPRVRSKWLRPAGTTLIWLWTKDLDIHFRHEL